MAETSLDPVHACAVCPRSIRRGLLMCYGHWRQVPRQLQLNVNRTWNGLNFGVRRNTLAALKDYMAARQAAIDAVPGPAQTTTTTTTGEPT